MFEKDILGWLRKGGGRRTRGGTDVLNKQSNGSKRKGGRRTYLNGRRNIGITDAIAHLGVLETALEGRYHNRTSEGSEEEENKNGGGGGGEKKERYLRKNVGGFQYLC